MPSTTGTYNPTTDTSWLLRLVTRHLQSLTGFFFSQRHGRFTLDWRQPLPSWARQVRLGVPFVFFSFLFSHGTRLAAVDYACLTCGYVPTWVDVWSSVYPRETQHQVP